MELPASALPRLAELDRSQNVTTAYRIHDGRLQAYPVDWHAPRWSQERVGGSVAALSAELDAGGTCFAIEADERLAGVAVLGNRPLGSNGSLLELVFLHVTNEQRGRGIGARLFTSAAERARTRGATGLYISATPSKPTVDFYIARGATLSDHPDEDRYTREPDDIHLVLQIE